MYIYIRLPIIDQCNTWIYLFRYTIFCKWYFLMNIIAKMKVNDINENNIRLHFK